MLLFFCHIRRYQRSHATRVWSIVITIACVLLLSRPAIGQINFSTGTVRQDTLYPTVEDCMGVMKREKGLSQQVDTTFYDTIPERFWPVSNHLPLRLKEAAQQCSRKFSVAQFVTFDSLKIAETINAFQLFYTAERISDALALAEGWLAKISDDTMRAELRSRVIDYAILAQPTRFDAIRQLTAGFVNTSFWVREYETQHRLMQRAKELKDTVEFNRIVTWILDAPTRLGDSAKVSQVASMIVEAKEYTQRETLLAKLRESTASYTEFRATLRKSFGGDQKPLEPAPPIVADHWLPNTPATARPTRGKVAIVMEIGNQWCNPCWPGLYHRLARKFPEMEFTLILRTNGHYGRFFGVLSPAEEVRVIDSLYRKRDGFPGMIAVKETRFTRVDDTYDRRILIEEGGAKQERYLPNLIDKNGNFVESVTLALDNEENYELLIRALLDQK